MTAPHRDALRTTVDRLEAAYAKAREQLAAELATGAWRLCEPEEMRDANGRYILLDALTAIVQARTTLAQVERP